VGLRRTSSTLCLGIEIRLVNPETGRDAAEGDVGEVWTPSDQNCAGYRGRPEANTELFVGEWLRTSDLGRRPDGYCYITGRIKDLIVSAGENVYASVVEAVLVRLAGVSEARPVPLGTQQISALSTSCRATPPARCCAASFGKPPGCGYAFTPKRARRPRKSLPKPDEGTTASAGLLSKSDRKRENIEGPVY
jgi:AMP-binding enzyme